MSTCPQRFLPSGVAWYDFLGISRFCMRRNGLVAVGMAMRPFDNLRAPVRYSTPLF
jgi:hypothetical protein